MILLTSTSDLLRVTTSSAAAVKVHASHVDRSGATITPGRLNTAIASATTTTIVASPAASTDRTVKFVSIYNDDASLSVTVTVLHTDGTTAVDMWSATLAPQQGLQYDEGAGWSAPEAIYATAAQGTLAGTAVQPGANANVLGSGSATDNFVLTANGSGGVAWEAAAGGGGTPGGTDTQVQFNDGGAFGGDSGFTFDKTNNTLNVTGATITASDPIIDMAQTWNNGAVSFTALKANVTDTASNAASLLMDLQVGGTSRFSVSKAGLSYATGFRTANVAGNAGFEQKASDSISLVNYTFEYARFGTTEIRLGSGMSFSFSSTALASSASDLTLFRDAANTLAQRNGVNAQAFNLYNTYTDASNYERGFMRFVSNALQIGAEKLGTGTARDIEFFTNGVSRLTIRADGSIRGSSGFIFNLSTSTGVWATQTTTPYIGSESNHQFSLMTNAVRRFTADTVGSVQITTALTVATLPATPLVGMMARVTDATSPTVGSTVVGGGAANAMCWYNGTNWTVIGA